MCPCCGQNKPAEDNRLNIQRYNPRGNFQAAHQAKHSLSGTKASTAQPDIKQVSTKDELNALGKPCFIMVHADWCGHCKTAKPNFMQLVSDNIVIVLVNADTAKDLVSEIGARGYPHFTYYDGRSFEDFNGPRTIEAWVNYINTK
jgi:thiol-disulfide isomerase/thioredoxin